MIETFKDQKDVQVIVFRLGNEEYTVPIMNVQEIIMPQKPTNLPKSPSWVDGIINLRGRIITIIDGKRKFAIHDTVSNKADARIIVLDVEQEIIGLVVDEVSEVIHLNTADIDAPPVDMGDDSEFLWGVGKYQNRLLILINPRKFLTKAEADDLKKLSKVKEAVASMQESVNAMASAK